MAQTVADWLHERGIEAAVLAERTSLPLRRVLAIVDGRWTPSPQDRRRIADALGLTVDDVVWGHTMDPRNIRYRQIGLPGNIAVDAVDRDPNPARPAAESD